MPAKHLRTLAIALLALPAPAWAGQSDDAFKRAAVSILGVDQSLEAMIAYCEGAAPGEGPVLRAGLRQWRDKAQVARIESALGAENAATTRTRMASVANAAVEKLRASGDPRTTCPTIPGWLDTGPFDTRTAYPAAYASAAPGAGPPEQADIGASAPAAARGATFYTPAQLRALADGWWGTPRSYERARRQLAAAGRIYIQGKVIRSGDRYFLKTEDGVFQSSLLVSTGLAGRMLAPSEGRTLTVEARMRDLPTAMVFLDDARIVDPAGLVPSPLPAELDRAPVSADKVTAQPGAGLKPGQIQGLVHHGYGATGANGYEFREDVLLLLKDGTFYRGEDVAPSRLDVARSRELQPQLWGRWRRQGSSLQLLPNDDQGRPKSAWITQEGTILTGWQPGQRLSGDYTHQAFHGSIGLGGVHNSTTYAFRPDGRFEAIGFARGGSGSMAAASGFVASASSLSTGEGTRSSAGGGGPGAFAGSSSSKADGASNRGSYRLDGYTLELTFDDGSTRAILAAPWGSKNENIYMLGRSFSRK